MRLGRCRLGRGPSGRHVVFARGSAGRRRRLCGRESVSGIGVGRGRRVDGDVHGRVHGRACSGGRGRSVSLDGGRHGDRPDLLARHGGRVVGPVRAGSRELPGGRVREAVRDRVVGSVRDRDRQRAGLVVRDRRRVGGYRERRGRGVGKGGRRIGVVRRDTSGSPSRFRKNAPLLVSVAAGYVYIRQSPIKRRGTASTMYRLPPCDVLPCGVIGPLVKYSFVRALPGESTSVNLPPKYECRCHIYDVQISPCDVIPLWTSSTRSERRHLSVALPGVVYIRQLPQLARWYQR